MRKPSFQGLSGEARSPEARRVFPFNTALTIVLAVEVDLGRIRSNYYYHSPVFSELYLSFPDDTTSAHTTSIISGLGSLVAGLQDIANIHAINAKQRGSHIDTLSA